MNARKISNGFTYNGANKISLTANHYSKVSLIIITKHHKVLQQTVRLLASERRTFIYVADVGNHRFIYCRHAKRLI